MREGVIISPLGKRFLRIIRVPEATCASRGQERVRPLPRGTERGEMVEKRKNDKQDESYSNRETRSWI